MAVDNNALRRFAFSGNATVGDIPFLYPLDPATAAMLQAGGGAVPVGSEGQGEVQLLGESLTVPPPSASAPSAPIAQFAPMPTFEGMNALTGPAFNPDAGQGGGGGGQGMGRGFGSTAPSLDVGGPLDNLSAALDAFAGAPMTPPGLMDTLAGLAFADDFTRMDMPSAWNALMEALGLGGSDDRGSSFGGLEGAPTGVAAAANETLGRMGFGGPVPGAPGNVPASARAAAEQVARDAARRASMKSRGLGPGVNRGYGGNAGGGGGGGMGGGGMGGGRAGAGGRGNRN